MKSIPLSSPHVHSQYCDGQSTAEEMVQAAIALGFVSLGISSHGVQDFDLQYAIRPEKEQAYIDEIRRLEQAYRPHIRLWLGTERDSLSLADRRRYEYVIGSLHYMRRAGRLFSVDGGEAQLREAIDHCYQSDGDAMAIDYYSSLGRYVAEYKPDIIGHFDLVMKHNRQGQLFNPHSPRVQAAVRDALSLAYAGCQLMEVNTGALARSEGGAIYPAPELLHQWRRLGGQVILASDCHQAAQMAFGYEEGLALMREAGYTSMLFLGRGTALFERSAI